MKIIPVSTPHTSPDHATLPLYYRIISCHSSTPVTMRTLLGTNMTCNNCNSKNRYIHESVAKLYRWDLALGSSQQSVFNSTALPLLSLSSDIISLLSLSSDIISLLSLSSDIISLLSLSSDIISLLSLSSVIILKTKNSLYHVYQS